jgi:antitoxin component HigA of HigAB toxin-antitoxin module
MKMDKPQIVRAANGEEMVLLSKADYEALVDAAAEAEEDAADLVMYDARMADLRSGIDARLPPEVSAALLKGASLLKALRKWRGLTQADLANATGMAQGYVSDLEAGRRKGTPETLAKIAGRLDIPVNWIVPGPV